MVIAAEQYASRLVVPQSQRTLPTRWSSHKELADKALRKLAGPHLPASLRQLEAAVKRAKEEHERAAARARTAAQRASRRAEAAEAADSADATQPGAPDAEAEVDHELDAELEEGEEAEQ